MSPVATVRDSGMVSLSEVGGDSWIGGGNIHQLEDLVLVWFLSWYARTRSCLGRIGTERGAVLISASFQERV